MKSARFVGRGIDRADIGENLTRFQVLGEAEKGVEEELSAADRSVRIV